MCEAMTDTSGQPAMPSKVGVRKRGRTPPSLQGAGRSDAEWARFTGPSVELV